MRNAQFCAVQVQDGSCVTSIACPNGVAATVRDEGRSFEVGNQVLISSHRTLPSLMRWPIACAMQHGVPQRVDAVEKVVGMSAVRNNRIIGADFLNGAFAFGACIESILLGDPPQNLFSTASVILGSYRTATLASGAPQSTDIKDRVAGRAGEAMAVDFGLAYASIFRPISIVISRHYCRQRA
jgi:hypothetical protein